MTQPTDDAVPPSRAKRDSLFLLADLHEEKDGRLIGQVRIRNLSATGLMAECERPLKEGDRVVFTLRGAGDVKASVSWWQDGRIGLVFDAEIDPLAARRPVAAGKTEIAEPYRTPRFTRGGR